MSINQYSSDINPETPWWRQQSRLMMEPLIQNASSSCGPPIHPSWATQGQLQQAPRVVNRGFNLNNQQDEEELLEEEEEEEEEVEVEVEVEVEEEENGRSRGRSGEEKEAMFEKALTPSDVGKLNRLVIPKQQAEKYFPLSDSGENKGVVLSFEDESCKCWRFRYSYWNSSQSYVLTKGWSRYVKDKRLLAGDVVCFLRLSSRLFISFRRRHTHDPNPTVGLPWTTTTTPFYSHSYPTHHQPFPFPPQPPPPGRGRQSHQKQSCNKVLRLFGVNMECQTPPETQDKQEEAGESTPQYPTTTHHMTSSSTYHNLYHYHHPSYAHHHMDVNQMRNRPG